MAEPTTSETDATVFTRDPPLAELAASKTDATRSNRNSPLAEPMTSKTDAIRSDRDSPLLKLPAELRNGIYGLALTSEEEIRVPKTGKLARPPLLQVCKQITQEATQLYYVFNTFYLEFTPSNLSHVKTWLGSIGEENAKVIGALRISLESWKEDCYGGPKWFYWDSAAAAIVRAGVRADNIVLLGGAKQFNIYPTSMMTVVMTDVASEVRSALNRVKAVMRSERQAKERRERLRAKKSDSAEDDERREGPRVKRLKGA